MRPVGGTFISITVLGFMMTTFLFAVLQKSIQQSENRRKAIATMTNEHVTFDLVKLWNPSNPRQPENTLPFKSVKMNSGEVLNHTFIKPHGAIFPAKAKRIPVNSVKYLIRHEKTCSQFSSLAYVVVLRSNPSNILRRQNLRQTWANQTLFSGMNARTVFLLGTTSDSQVQNTVNAESRIYNDIVQFDFKDNSDNMTLKAVLGLRWIAENCQNAGFVINVEDTAFVNIFKVLDEYAPILAANPKQLICSVEKKGTIFRRCKHDSSNSKWMVPDNYFPELSFYPMPFCYRFAAFMSAPLSVELFQMVKTTPFFPLDDVYVYGILASKVKGLTWRDERKNYLNENTLVNLLNNKRRSHGSVVSVSSVFDGQDLWRQLMKLWV